MLSSSHRRHYLNNIRRAQAEFSADKESLVKGATIESRQKFENVSTLGELRHLLQVICEELVEYQLWPVSLGWARMPNSY